MKAIKHAHHEQYLRLSNEDAALLVSSGRWVFVSKFQAREAAMKPRRQMWRRVLLVAVWLAAVLAALVVVGANAAHARPCESLATVQKKHPGQYARYRSVEGQKCWYVGKRVPAKSEFVIAKKSNAVANVSVEAPGHGQKRPVVELTSRLAAGRTAATTSENGRDSRERPAPSWKETGTASYEEQINDAFLALCGGPCPQLMTFEDRWKL